MNTAIIKLTNCQDCQYCDHNGMLQSLPKYICNHKAVYGKNKIKQRTDFSIQAESVLCLTECADDCKSICNHQLAALPQQMT